MSLNVGIIGCGKSATRYHLPYILIRKNLSVKTIYSRSKNNELEKRYEKYNINFTQDIKDILDDNEIELVTICTPPSTHYELAKACLEHNKNVLVEKPFTLNLEEARKIFNLAKEKKLIIMPYQNRRYDSDFLAVKKAIESGKLGEIVEIESHFDYYRPSVELIKGSKYEGALYGLGVHLIDQIVSLYGSPNKIYYDVRSIRNKENPDDYFDIQLFYDNLKVILKTNHLVKTAYPKFIVHGTKGSFIKQEIDKQEECLKNGIMPGERNFGIEKCAMYGIIDYIDYNGEEKKEVIPTPLGDYGRVYDNIYNVIKNGAKPFVGEKEVLIVLEILEKAFARSNPKVVES